LTVQDVAGLLRIHRGSVWRLVSLSDAGHGDFPRAVRLGPKTIRWRACDIAGYLEKLAGADRG